MSKKVLVYGFYHQSNIGDQLFVDAFQYLFPNYQFIFCNSINLNDLQKIDVIFFGGGSFLLKAPNISNEALDYIKTMPIFYLGIGVEAEIHPIHIELISLAKIIATRSKNQISKLKIFNANTIYIPDLAYSLNVEIKPKLGRSILVLPNISVVPNHMDAYWKHAAWLRFKSEFAQFLDYLSNDYNINFLSMSTNPKDNDDRIAYEIMSHMIHNALSIIKDYQNISQYDLIITQRFHGLVLCEMTRTPYVAIHHHDKLKFASPNNGEFISYYSATKQDLIDCFNKAIKMKFESLPIKKDIFETFSQKITELVEEHDSLYRNQAE